MIIAIPDDYHDVVKKLDCLATLSGHDVRIFRDVAPSPARLLDNLKDADAIVPIRERTRYTRELIERLPRLKLFSQTGRSIHHIDKAACTERGIVVSTGSKESVQTVAEHTWALILASRRRVTEGDVLMRRGALRPEFSAPLRGPTLASYRLGTAGKRL